MDDDRLLEVQLSREEVRILHQALNNALEFVPAGDFGAVMGVGPETVRTLMLKLALAIDPMPQPLSANRPRA